MRTGHAPETKQNVTLLKSNKPYMSKCSQFMTLKKQSLKIQSVYQLTKLKSIDNACHLLHHSLTCHLQSCCRNPGASSMCLWELIAYDAPAQYKEETRASKLIAKGNYSTLWLLMHRVAARKPIFICIQC